MTSPLLEKVRAALATVNDPEIKRPITDLKMVEGLAIDDTGRVTLTVLLTVSGCPMKDTITRDVNAAVRAVRRRHRRGPDARGDDPRAARRAPGDAARRPGAARDPVRPGLLADQGLRDRLRQGWRRQVLGHRQPRPVDGQAGAEGRHRRRRHLRPLGAGDARRGRHPADPGRGPDHAGAHRERRLRDQHRHAQAEARAGRRLARADARPGARADARPTSTGATSTSCSSTCRPAPATWRSRSASTCRTPRSWS